MDPQALNVEVFYGWVPHEDCPNCAKEHRAELMGYYWQACFPGCLPDGEPNGPFATEAEAIADAQDGEL